MMVVMGSQVGGPFSGMVSGSGAYRILLWIPPSQPCPLPSSSRSLVLSWGGTDASSHGSPRIRSGGLCVQRARSVSVWMWPAAGPTRAIPRPDPGTARFRWCLWVPPRARAPFHRRLSSHSPIPRTDRFARAWKQGHQGAGTGRSLKAEPRDSPSTHPCQPKRRGQTSRRRDPVWGSVDQALNPSGFTVFPSRPDDSFLMLVCVRS